MGGIVPFLHKRSVFEPDDITAMSRALEEVCSLLKLDGDATAEQVVAIRIIELAQRGERSPEKLRDRVLQEANGLAPQAGRESDDVSE